ncbi:MAG TPA: LysR substrate-binding domain-containing protein [Acidimicrobiales bacterium]
MELRQLRYVVAVAEEGNFTRAAARAHVAQPAISQQIAQVERELGAPLFERSPRGVALTAAGAAFLPHARAALAAATAGSDAVRTLRGELAGDLAVGTIPSPSDWLVRRLGAFGRRHPAVRVTLRAGDPEALAGGVAAGSLDAAAVGVMAGRLPAGPAGRRLPAGLASQTIATEPLVVAVPPDHPLAGAGAVSLSDLQDQPLVTLTPGTGLRAVLESACAEAGFEPRIAVDANDLGVLADLVAHGLGVGLMPTTTARQAGARVAVLRLQRPRLERRTDLVWRRQDQSLPARAFLAMVRARDDAGAAGDA